MENRMVETNEKHLNALRKKTKNLYRFFLVLLALTVLAWVGLIVFAGVGIAMPDSFGITFAKASVNFVSILIIGAVLSLMLRIVCLILRDVSKNGSPFIGDQVKRIRVVAFLLFLYVIIDMILSLNFTTLVIANSFGVENLTSYETTTTVLSVNVGALAASAIMYGVSIVFEYGCRLQQISDELV